jgi:tetratricopeptide (TPR) repeat protein
MSTLFKKIACVPKSSFGIISRGANQAWEKRFDVFFQETKIEISTRQHDVAHRIARIQSQHSFQDCNKDASFLKTKLDLEKAHYLFYLPIPDLGNQILTVLQQMTVDTTTPEAIRAQVSVWISEALQNPTLPNAIKQDLSEFVGRKYEPNAYLFWQEQQCLLVDDFNGNVTDFFELQQQQFKALLAIAETPEEKAALFALKSNEMRDLLYSHRLDVRSSATCSWFETLLGLQKTPHAEALFEAIKTRLQSDSPHRERAHALCEYLLKYEIAPSISVYEDMGKLLLDTDSPKTVLMWRDSANAWATRTLTSLFGAFTQLDGALIQTYTGVLLYQVEALNNTGSERERFSKTIAGYADLIHYASGCVTYIATHVSDRFTKHDFKAMCHDFLLYRSLQRYAERDIQKAKNPFDSVQLAKNVSSLSNILPQVQLQVLQYADLVTQAEFLTFSRYLRKDLSEFSEKKSLVSAFKHMVIQDYLPSNRVQNTAFLLFGNLFSLKGYSPEQIHHWLKSSVLSEKEADITQSICSLMPSDVAIPLIVKQLTEAHPLHWDQRLAAIESDAVFNRIREKHCEFPTRISVFSEEHNTYFSTFMQTLNYNYFEYIGALVDARKTMIASTADQSAAESILRLSHGLQKIKEAIIENSNDILPQNPRHWKSIFKEILGSKIEGSLTNAGLLFLLKIAREHSDSLYERLESDVSAETFLRGLVKHVLFGHSKVGIESACNTMLDSLPLACVLELGSAYHDNATYQLDPGAWYTLIQALDGIKKHLTDMIEFQDMPFLYWHEEIDKIRWKTCLDWKGSGDLDEVVYAIALIKEYSGDPIPLLEVLATFGLTNEEKKDALEKFARKEWRWSAKFVELLPDAEVKTPDMFTQWVTSIQKPVTPQSQGITLSALEAYLLQQQVSSPLIARCRSQITDALKLFNQKKDSDLVAFKAELRDIQALDVDAKRAHIPRMLACIMWGVFMIEKFELNNPQLLALMLFIDSENSSRGRLLEIGTGEGKTIVGIAFALYLSLLGRNVDVHTSQKKLAMDASQKHQALYELFEVPMSNNCDEEAFAKTDVRKRRYDTCRVLYGQTGDFQRDRLLTDFCYPVISSRPNVMGIFDEVDSVVLDNAATVHYLAQNIPDYLHLDPLYLYIYRAVCAPNVYQLLLKGSSESYEHAKQKIKSHLEFLMLNNDLILPNRLKDLVERRMDGWIENAILVRRDAYHDNRHYVRASSMETDAPILIVDENTGEELESTQWSYGVHQFLHIKHREPISPESLKSVYMSNMAAVRNYTGNIVGMTGTLGDPFEKSLLAEIYDVDVIKIPRNLPDRFYEKPGIVCETRPAQYAAIQTEIQACRDAFRPVLIFCETIEEALALETKLKENTDFADKITVFKSVYQDIASQLEPGHIYISTNIAGRGADFTFKPTQQSDGDTAPEESEGLHVILSYIPKNRRIEEQAFRRAARKGEKGSGQFIVVDAQQRSILRLRSDRDQLEIKRLQAFKETEKVRIEVEDNLLALFKDFRQFVKTQLTGLALHPDIIALQLDYLGHRWAEWIDENDAVLQRNPHEKKESYKRDFAGFQGQMVHLLNQNSDFRFVENSPEGLLALGRLYQDQKLHQKAVACFKSIIEKEPNFSEKAHYYLAGSLLEQNRHDLGTKKAVKKHLKIARKLMTSKIRILTDCNGIYSGLDWVSLQAGSGTQGNRYADYYKNLSMFYMVHIQAIDQIIGTPIKDNTFIWEGLVLRSSTEPLSTQTASLLGDADSEEKSKLLPFMTVSDVMTFGVSNDFLRPLRWSQKVSFEQQDDGWQIYRLDGDKKIDIDWPSRLVILKETLFYQRIMSVFSGGNRAVTPEFFKDMVMGKSELWAQLIRENYVIADPKKSDTFIWNTQVRKPLLESDFIVALSESNRIALGQALAKETVCQADMPGHYDTTQEAIRNTQLALQSVGIIRSEKTNLSITEKNGSWLESICDSMGNGRYIPFEIFENKLKALLPANLKAASEKINLGLSKADIKLLDQKIAAYVDQVVGSLKSSAGYLKVYESLTFGLQDLNESLDLETIPPEITQFQELNFDKVLQMNEYRSRFDPRAMVVALFGLVQIAAGIAIGIASGGLLMNISLGLVSEGIGDILFASIAGLTKTFSWQSYAKMKAISLTLAILSMGTDFAALSRGLKVTVDASDSVAIAAGTAIRSSKTFGKASITMATKKVLTESGKRLAVQVSSRVAGLIVDEGLDNIINEFSLTIKHKIKSHSDLASKVANLKEVMSSIYRRAGEEKATVLIRKVETEILGHLGYAEVVANIAAVMEKISACVDKELKKVMHQLPNSEAIKTGEMILKIISHILKGLEMASELADLTLLACSFHQWYHDKLQAVYSNLDPAQPLSAAVSDDCTQVDDRCRHFSQHILDHIVKKARSGHLKSGIKSSVSATVGATVDYLEHHDLRFSDITHLASHQHGHASHDDTSASASSAHATSGHVRGRSDHDHVHYAHDRHVHEHFHVTPAFVVNCCIDATDAIETVISQFQMTAKNQTDRVAKWEKTLEKLSKKYRDVSPESGGSPNKSSVAGSFQTTQKCMGDRQRQIDDLATLKKKYSDFSASWDDLFNPKQHSEAMLFERNRRLVLLTTS